VALTGGKLHNPFKGKTLERLDELEKGYNAADWADRVEQVEDKIRMIFHDDTLSQILYMQKELDSAGTEDAFIIAVLLGALHGSSEGFLSVSMPNTFSMSWRYIKKFIEKNGLLKPERNVFSVLKKRIEKVLGEGRLQNSEGEVHTYDVRKLGEVIPVETVDLLFTSPPYLKVIKYGLYNWIRLWYLKEDYQDVDSILDDTHAIDEYLIFMNDTLNATLPLINPTKGFACWVIGDVGGTNLALKVWKYVEEAQEKSGNKKKWALLSIIDDEIPPEEKMTKMWKTLVYKLINLDEKGSKEEIAEYTTKKEANSALKERSKDYPNLKILVEKTNDKTGKATQIDRILILAPIGSVPVANFKDSQMVWKERPKRYSARISKIKRNLLQNSIERVDNLGKVEVLSSIISHGNRELDVKDFSDGSTVTKAGLRAACVSNSIALPKKVTKKNLLKAMLESVGDKLEDGDYIKNGGTVTTKSLVRFYKLLLRGEKT